MSNFAFAYEIKYDNDGAVEFIADEEQIAVMDDLIGQDITYKQLLEKVFPEAIKYTPSSALENMEKTKVDWRAINSGAQELEGVKTTSDVSTRASVNSFSDLDEHGDTVQFYSWQYSTISMPYMSVWSYLYYDPTSPAGDTTTLKKYSYKSNTNCMYLSTDEKDYDNAPTGYYRTTGVHYVQFPAGYTPSSATATSYSGYGSWRYHD